MTVSEENSEAHICEIHVVEINELVTGHPDRKPPLDRRKQAISEGDSSEPPMLGTPDPP